MSLFFLLHCLAPTALAQASMVSELHRGNCQSPTWSRDGSKLAYEVNYHERRSIELYVYEMDGELREITPRTPGGTSLTSGFSERSGGRVVHQPAWSPAAMDRLVYSASTTAMDFDLYLDRGSALAPAMGTDGDAVWSHSGRWLAFTSSRTGQGDIYLLDLFQAGSPPRRLTDNESAAELDAAFSPVDDRLLFTAHTDSGDDLFLIDDPTQPNPVQVTDLARSQVRASWSPDGTHIAFYSNHDFVDRTDLYVMRLGSQPYALAHDVLENHAGPSWTPDGSAIVYVLDDDAEFDPIYRVPIADPEQAIPLTTGTVGNGDIDIVATPEGQTWIAWTAQGLETDEIRDFKRVYVMELPPN